MISWIQSTFQHHFKLVFAILILVMVIPLVFIYSTSGGIGRADQEIQERKVFGKPYTTEHDRREFAMDGQISLQLTTGQAFFSPEQAEYYAFFRAAKLAVADKLGVPQPTQKQLESFIKSLPAFQGENGQYDREAYARFLDNTKNNPIYSQSRISRVLMEDWRAERANEAISGAGYALDTEVREELATADTVWTVHRASLSTKDIKAEGEPTEADLQQWFDLHAARYRHPPSVQVSVVGFPAERFASQVEQPTDDDIVRHFEANKSSYAAAPQDGQAVAVEPKLEDVRDRVKQDLLQQRAQNAATKAASDFAYVLFDKGIKRGMPAFDALLREVGSGIQPMQPIPITPQASSNPLMREALTLSEDKPVSDPVVLGTVAMVLFFDGRTEASDAAFSEVRDRVLADVQQDRRMRAVVDRGEQIRAQLAAAVKAGTPFPEAAKSAGLEVKTWENFTRRTLPQDFDTSMPGRLIEQPVGEVSAMTVRGDEGTFVFIGQRKEPVVTSEDPNYAEARRNLMAENSRMTGQMTLMEMVRAERIAVGIDRPAEAAAQ